MHKACLRGSKSMCLPPCRINTTWLLHQNQLYGKVPWRLGDLLKSKSTWVFPFNPSRPHSSVELAALTFLCLNYSFSLVLSWNRSCCCLLQQSETFKCWLQLHTNNNEARSQEMWAKHKYPGERCVMAVVLHLPPMLSFSPVLISIWKLQKRSCYGIILLL